MLSLLVRLPAVGGKIGVRGFRAVNHAHNLTRKTSVRFLLSLYQVAPRFMSAHKFGNGNSCRHFLD